VSSPKYENFRRVNRVLYETVNWLEAEVEKIEPRIGVEDIPLDELGRCKIALELLGKIQTWKSMTQEEMVDRHENK
jgi:hypothetical protein